MTAKERTCEVAIHVNQHLPTRETYWSAQLCPLQPHDLNKNTSLDLKTELNIELFKIL